IFENRSHLGINLYGKVMFFPFISETELSIHIAIRFEIRQTCNPVAETLGIFGNQVANISQGVRIVEIEELAIIMVIQTDVGIAIQRKVWEILDIIPALNIENKLIPAIG